MRVGNGALPASTAASDCTWGWREGMVERRESVEEGEEEKRRRRRRGRRVKSETQVTRGAHVQVAAAT